MLFPLDISVRRFLSLSIAYDMTEFVEEAGKIDQPEKLTGKPCLQDLNGITFGQRIDLNELNAYNYVYLPVTVLHHFTDSDILNCNAGDLLRFNKMITDELIRLNERDNKFLKYDPEPEEIKAGFKKLDNGLFGTIDTIARRMVISHDEVLQLSQQKVFMMLKIDLDSFNYSKRLRKVYSERK